MSDPRDRFSPKFSFKPVRKQRAKPEPTPAGKAETDQPGAAPGPAPAAGAPASAAGDFRQWVGAPKATLAIVFTDIVSSAALGNKLGNQAMAVVRRAHFRQAEQLVGRHGGYVIKTIGDSVMAAFHAATDALDFAMAVHADPGDRRLKVRAGVHVGPVGVEARDAHGTTVNYAARVVAVPIEAEVWLSSEAKGHVDQDRAPHHANLRWQVHRGLELKGFPGKHILWSVTGG